MRRTELGSRAVGRRSMTTGLLLSLSLACVPFVVWSFELGEPTFQDRQISKAIASRMPLYHLSNRVMDDEISREGLHLLIKGLDPQKLYFYKSDIEEFEQSGDRLDDFAKAGDLSFAFTVFNRFLTRIEERLVTINELVDMQHDYTVREEMVTDPDLLDYPASPEEARDRWRQRIKYSFLLLKAEGTEGAEAQDKLRRRYTSFARRMEQFDAEEVTEMFLTALTTAYDPHSTYFSKTTYENFLIQMRLNLEGIGASLQSEDGVTVIKRIVPGGAADKLGLIHVEDKIVSVGQGETGEMIDVADMKLDDVVAMIRGPAGTVVRLGIMHDASNEMKTYSIVRERIELRDSEAQSDVFEAGTKPDGTPYRVGVINLPSFYADMEAARRGVEEYKSTTRDVARLLGEFREQNVDAVVLDLRTNGGGSLPEAVDCTGLFIDQGPVVQVKDSTGSSEVLSDDHPGVAWDGPLVVVTSKFSASASEILAGAIQDYNRGLIVGDTATHGKGTVQSLMDVGRFLFRLAQPPDNYGALKVTMQQFYRPSGDSTQQRGVLADIVLPAISDHMPVGESDLEHALEFDKIAEADFDRVNMVSADLVAQLREQSTARVGQSEDFQDVETDIERYREQKARKTVSLNEEEFFARRAEFDADKEDEETIQEQVNNPGAIKRDFYLDEVLAITVDYVQSLSGQPIARN
ncbi:MAG: carboxy terminal-processing peptidase [Planctomycetales bacterium]|nr:carboxy terminal-processing peptidase [Planctomycetales bacterium]